MGKQSKIIRDREKRASREYSATAQEDIRRGKKYCNHCKKYHDLSAFYTCTSRGLTYFQTKCKVWFQEYRKNNAERYCKHVQAWRKRNPGYETTTPQRKAYKKRKNHEYYVSNSDAHYREMFESEHCDQCGACVKGSESALVYSNVQRLCSWVFCSKECAEKARGGLYPQNGCVQSLKKKRRWYDGRKKSRND